MKHRIGGLYTGLGGGRGEMHNNGYIHPLILWKVYYALKAYKYYAKVDFKVTEFYTQIGFEASYQGDKERYFIIHSVIDNCRYVDGIAWGYYGTDIAKTTKWYTDFKRNCKTKRLLYRLHELIYPNNARIF